MAKTAKPKGKRSKGAKPPKTAPPVVATVPMGRPTDYTAELALRICDEVAEGKSLVVICADPEMPSRSTVHSWILRHSEFSDSYALARTLRAELYADQIIEIADSPLVAQKTVTKPSGVEVTVADSVERSRLMIDARKWYAAKLDANYSEKVKQEVSGSLDGPPVVNVTLTGPAAARARDRDG